MTSTHGIFPRSDPVFTRGDETLPGWRVRFTAGAGHGTQSYRVQREDGTRAFLKVFDTERVGEERLGPDGRIREIAVLESLGHPGVPRVLGSGKLDHEDRTYLLMDLIPGETLNALLSRRIALTYPRARQLMKGLAETAARLHGRGDPVFHNQLTPAHVVLDVGKDRDGIPVVVGFGSARQASDGAAPISSGVDPHYLPSECGDGPVASASVDVFALGALWFQALFGLPPWSHGVQPSERARVGLDELTARRRQGPPPIPAHLIYGEPPQMDLQLVGRALAFDPGERFADAGALLNAMTGNPPHLVAAPRGTVPVAPFRRDSREPGGSPLSGFNRIAGMEDLKATLVADVVNPLRDSAKYRRFGVGIPNGVLLYGPPGCGKTFFAECLAQEIGFAFEAPHPSELGSHYVHGPQANIAKLFDTARKQAPCILFVDEADALIPCRGVGLHFHYASAVNEWLTQLNRAADDGVFVIAATNRPDRLDPAALRTGRLDKNFYVEPPDREARKAMFGLHLSGRPLDGAVNLDCLAERTEGWMASDLLFLVDEAARAAVAADAPGISEAHLMGAIQRNPPSIGPQQIAEYEAIHARFRRGGNPDAGSTGRRIGFSQS